MNFHSESELARKIVLLLNTQFSGGPRFKAQFFVEQCRSAYVEDRLFESFVFDFFLIF